MALSKVDKNAIEQWKLKTEEIRRATISSAGDTKEEIAKRIARAKKDYAYFVDYYFPHYAKAPCADFQLKAARKILSRRDIFAILEWAREHAKSVHADVLIPLWLKINDELDGMILVGKSEDAACRLLGDIQAELQSNGRFIADFGPQFQYGTWEEGDFTTADGIAFIALGRGQSPRGLRNREKRPNYCAVDDIDDDKLCKNQKLVGEVVDWILEALYGALAIKGARVVVAGNRIHRRSVLAHLVGDVEPGDAKREGIWHSKVCAIENGKPAWHQNYTLEELQRKMTIMGYRRAQKEYFHNAITEGGTFKSDWIQWGKVPPLHELDDLVMYCDPSFKGGAKNDYKAIRLWGKKGKRLYLIKSFVRQCSISEAVRWVYDWYEEHVRNARHEVVVPFYMEAGFIQDLLLDDFDAEGEARGWMLPVRPDRRDKPDKYSRIENTSPLYERGLIIYNEAERKNRDMLTGLEQLLAIEQGNRGHDDAPDADEGAIWLLQRQTRQQSSERRIGSRTPAGW